MKSEIASGGGPQKQAVSAPPAAPQDKSPAPVLDAKVLAAWDAKLAERILSTHMGTEKIETESFEKDLLRKYIAYARRKVSPKLQQGASTKILSNP